jgi:formate dehydrogenase subunit gamma
MEHWSPDAARAEVEPLAGLDGALLPMLHALQERFGFVHVDAVPMVAELLNLSRAEVHGVLSFYRDFRTSPPAGPTVRVCRAEACQAVGADALWAHARRVASGVELDDVFCLGNCALGPSVQVSGRLHGRVDSAMLDALLAEAWP